MVFIRRATMAFSPRLYIRRAISMTYSSRLYRTSRTIAPTLPRLPIFEALAAHDPKGIAIVHSVTGRKYTYGSLLADTAEYKAMVLENIETDDLREQRMVFVVENGYDYVGATSAPSPPPPYSWAMLRFGRKVSLLGIFAAGGIAVPVCPTHSSQEMRYIVSDSSPSLILTTGMANAHEAVPPYASHPPIHYFAGYFPGHHPPAVTLVPPLDASRGALMIYTSGTTSLPKGVILTHKALTAQAKILTSAWEISSSDHLLHALPLHHIHGIVNATLAPLFAGGTIEFSFPFNPSTIWHRFSEFGKPPVTLFMAVPTIYSRLVNTFPSLPESTQSAAKKALGNLRLAISGSAALPGSVKDKWQALGGGVMLERYGMTEVGMALSQRLPLEDRMTNSVGWPLPGVQVRLMSGEEEVKEPGKEGEIQIKGDTVFREYWQKKEKTEQEFTKDGWFKTGDIAVLDERGAYYIKGRGSVDIIKSGGEKVSALEVERELLELPQIAEAAVVGLEDEEWGQKVAVAVVLSNKGREEGFTLEDMRKAMKERVSAHKVPKDMRILPMMPRSQIGKVNKKALMKEVWGVEK